jgi:hypothetical protein
MKSIDAVLPPPAGHVRHRLAELPLLPAGWSSDVWYRHDSEANSYFLRAWNPAKERYLSIAGDDYPRSKWVLERVIDLGEPAMPVGGRYSALE